MIKNICLGNFRSFENIQDIPIKPITLVYGANSVGKSSILKALLLMKQSLEDATNLNSNLATKGHFVDVGNYKDFINKQDLTKDFSFKFDFDISSTNKKNKFVRPFYYRYNRIKNINYLSIEYVYSYNNVKNGVLSEIKLYLNNSTEPFLKFKKSSKKIEQQNFRKIRIRSLQTLKNESDLTSIFVLDYINWESDYFQDFWKSAEEKIKKHKIIDKVKDNIVSVKNKIKKHKQKDSNQKDLFGDNLDNLNKKLKIYIEIDEFLSDNAECKNKFKNIFNKYYETNLFLFVNLLFFDEYNSSENEAGILNTLFRTRLSHFYYENEIDLNLNLNQEISDMLYISCRLMQQYLTNMKYLGALRDNPERYYLSNPGTKNYVGKSGKNTIDIIAHNITFKNKINKQLEALNIGYTLVPRKIPNEDIYLFLLKEKDSGITVSLNDIGFGVSQILPILVQSMLSKNETIIIEQPEIHIHPKLQAELGTLFAECIKEPYNNNFIIETHSENIILRLQKLIRKKIITSEDVSVIYVDKDITGATCLNLRLDESGNFIDKWPNGFFEESFEEIFG
jgi:AAA15 family ATPase/GTPase